MAGDWLAQGPGTHGAKGLSQEKAYVTGLQAGNQVLHCSNALYLLCTCCQNCAWQGTGLHRALALMELKSSVKGKPVTVLPLILFALIV